MSQRLFSSSDYAIDFFHSTCPNGRVVVTFTEFSSRDLEGRGFGGSFLLSSGFDVVAVKSCVDRWYQDLNPSAIGIVADFLDSHRHISRASYGSSMGGYASFLFSKELDLDVAFAISPQYDITLDIDTRWAGHLNGGMRTMGPTDIGPKCQYVVLHDPMDADRHHVDLFRSVIPDRKFHPIGIKYSGHPTGQTMIYSGALKTIASATLSGQIPPLPHKDMVKAARESPLYFYKIADACRVKKHFAVATALISKAIEKQPLNAEQYILAARIASEAGDVSLALQRASAAVALNPKHPHMNAFLAYVLVRCHNYSAAVHYFDRALEVVQEPAWIKHRGELLR